MASGGSCRVAAKSHSRGATNQSRGGARCSSSSRGGYGVTQRGSRGGGARVVGAQQGDVSKEEDSRGERPKPRRNGAGRTDSAPTRAIAMPWGGRAGEFDTRMRQMQEAPQVLWRRLLGGVGSAQLAGEPPRVRQAGLSRARMLGSRGGPLCQHRMLQGPGRGWGDAGRQAGARG